MWHPWSLSRWESGIITHIACQNFRFLTRVGIECEKWSFKSENERTHLSLVDELDEGGPLHLDGVLVAVEQLDHEVEEVGLAQVRGRLLRELDTTEGASERKRNSHK